MHLIAQPVSLIKLSASDAISIHGMAMWLLICRLWIFMLLPLCSFSSQLNFNGERPVVAFSYLISFLDGTKAKGSTKINTLSVIYDWIRIQCEPSSNLVNSEYNPWSCFILASFLHKYTNVIYYRLARKTIRRQAMKILYFVVYILDAMVKAHETRPHSSIDVCGHTIVRVLSSEVTDSVQPPSQSDHPMRIHLQAQRNNARNNNGS